MKNIFLILFILFITGCASTTPSTPSSENEKINYFNEVVFGSEFGSSNNKLKKWPNDLKIYVAGQPPEYLTTELELLIVEINTLIGENKLKQVQTEDLANYVIYFGSGDTYAKIESRAESKVKDNWGLFWVYWNGNNELYKGSMYVDTERTRNKNAQKHLLREELTQSLGIMNDSYQYDDSIFYQKWTKTTQYSDLDKYIIRTLYLDKVKPGMSKKQVNKLLIP